MGEVLLAHDSNANGTAFGQDRNLFEMRTGDRAPRGASEPRMQELIEYAQEAPLSIRLWFDPATNPGDLGRFVRDRLWGLGQVQREVRAQGQRFDVVLSYGIDRVNVGEGQTWHPDFPFELAMTGSMEDFTRRLRARGWPEAGAPKMIGISEEFWRRFAEPLGERRRVPVAYGNDVNGGLDYEIRAVILDLSKERFWPWLVRSLTELRAAVEEFVDLHAWLIGAKDKHYIWDPARFGEHRVWLWPPHPVTEPEPVMQYSGLWLEPSPYAGLLNWQVIRTRAVRVVHQARIPAIHRIWRPEGIRYEEFFTAAEAYDLGLGWAR